MYLKLCLNLLGSQGWPKASDHPIFTHWVLGLQQCIATLASRNTMLLREYVADLVAQSVEILTMSKCTQTPYCLLVSFALIPFCPVWYLVSGSSSIDVYELINGKVVSFISHNIVRLMIIETRGQIWRKMGDVHYY